MALLSTIIAWLRPSPADVVALARREGDVDFAPSFEPICHGPVVAALILAAIGIVGAACAPFRLAFRVLGVRR